MILVRSIQIARNTAVGSRRFLAVGKSAKRSLLGPVFFLGLSLTAAGLGTWQVQRYYWKVDLLEKIGKRSHEEALLLRNKEDFDFLVQRSQHDSDSLLGRPVLLTGELLHDFELLVGPRAAPRGLVTPAAQGMATNPQGYNVITPLRIDENTVVFVNRGWIPRQSAGSFPKPTGHQTLRCLATKTEDQKDSRSKIRLLGGQSSLFMPKNTESSFVDKRQLIFVEEEKLQRVRQEIIPSTGSNPNTPAEILLFEALEAEEEDGKKAKSGPYAKRLELLATHHVHPATHAAYAVTWFTLSLAGCVMNYLKFFRK